MSGTGTQTYLRVGIDGTGAQEGARTVVRSCDDITASAKNAVGGADGLSKQLDSLGYSAKNLTGILTGLVGALAAAKLASLAQDSTMLAARVETLGVVMHAVGQNVLYTNTQMDDYAKGVEKMGITTESSRQSIIKMAQSNLDLNKSQDMARIAQDAAVIANTNSSDAFDKMILGMSTGQAIILHHMGLMVNFEKGYQDTAAALGKSTTELSESEKATSRMNEVIKASINIQGSYEASMTTAGKAMLSMSRLTTEAKLALGEVFLPSFTTGVFAVTDGLKYMNAHLSQIKDTSGSIIEIGLAIYFARTASAVMTYTAAQVDAVAVTLLSQNAGVSAAASNVLMADGAAAATLATLEEADAMVLAATATRSNLLAQREALLTQDQLAASSAAIAVADAEVAAAEAAKSAAMIANAEAAAAAGAAQYGYTTAVEAATISARVATGVMAGLNTVMGLAGGPLGLIVLAIGSAEYAWIKYTEAAKEAEAQHARMSNASTTAGMLKGISELEAQIKSATATPESKQKEAENTASVTMNRLLGERLTLTAELASMQESASTSFFGSSQKEIKDKEYALSLVHRDIDNLPKLVARTKELTDQQTALQDARKKAADEDNQTYQTAEEYGASLRKSHEGYLAYVTEWDKRVLDAGNNARTLELNALGHQKEALLITEQEFQDKSLAIKTSAASAASEIENRRYLDAIQKAQEIASVLKKQSDGTYGQGYLANGEIVGTDEYNSANKAVEAARIQKEAADTHLAAAKQDQEAYATTSRLQTEHIAKEMEIQRLQATGFASQAYEMLKASDEYQKTVIAADTYRVNAAKNRLAAATLANSADLAAAKSEVASAEAIQRARAQTDQAGAAAASAEDRKAANDLSATLLSLEQSQMVALGESASYADTLLKTRKDELEVQTFLTAREATEDTRKLAIIDAQISAALTRQETENKYLDTEIAINNLKKEESGLTLALNIMEAAGVAGLEEQKRVLTEISLTIREKNAETLIAKAIDIAANDEIKTALTDSLGLLEDAYNARNSSNEAMQTYLNMLDSATTKQRNLNAATQAQAAATTSRGQATTLAGALSFTDSPFSPGQVSQSFNISNSGGVNPATQAVIDANNAAITKGAADAAQAAQTAMDAWKAAQDAAQKMGQDLSVRNLAVQGLTEEAKMQKLVNDQYNELGAAQKVGISTTALLVTQNLEYNAALKAFDFAKVTASTKTFFDTLKTSLSDVAGSMSSLSSSLSGTSVNLKNARAGLNVTTGSPEDAYTNSRSQLSGTYLNAMKTGDNDLFSQLPSLVSTFLANSKSYNGSGAGYQSDLTYAKQLLDTSGAAADAAATSAAGVATAAQKQQTTLDAIQAALTTNNSAALPKLLAELSSDNGALNSSIRITNEALSENGAIASQVVGVNQTLINPLTVTDPNLAASTASLTTATGGITTALAGTLATSNTQLSATGSVVTALTGTGSIKDSLTGSGTGALGTLLGTANTKLTTINSSTGSVQTALGPLGYIQSYTGNTSSYTSNAQTYLSNISANSGKLKGSDAVNLYPGNGGIPSTDPAYATRVNGVPIATGLRTTYSYYAEGGNYGGGSAIMGEKGPELVDSSPGYVYRAEETKQLFNLAKKGAADNYSIHTNEGSEEEIVAELRALRREVAELKAHTAAGVRTAQAGFSQLVDQGEQSNKDTAVLARSAKMVGARGN